MTGGKTKTTRVMMTWMDLNELRYVDSDMYEQMIHSLLDDNVGYVPS